MLGIRKPLVGALGLLLPALAATPAVSHPHIIADVKLEFQYQPDGTVSAIRQHWQYDAFYSAFVRRMADTDRDGRMSDSERRAFGEKQITALAKFDYYTSLSAADTAIGLSPATDHALSDENGVLTLRFTLPLQAPMRADDYAVKIFDPQFFAYFTTAEERGVALTGAPSGCAAQVTTPQSIDLKNTASVPAALWKAIDGSVADGRKFVNRVSISCR